MMAGGAEDGAGDTPAMPAGRRVARVAWFDCADGATRRELACQDWTACPYGTGVCPFDVRFHPAARGAGSGGFIPEAE